MKAEPRRRSHTIGAQWLRQGSEAPVMMQTEVRESGNSKQDGVIIAKKAVDSEISGDLVEKGVKQNLVRENQENQSFNFGADNPKK